MTQTLTALRLELSGEVLHVIMNRPAQLNALNTQLTTELREVFHGLYFDRTVRVVILRGEGRAFCAGLDLKETSSGRSSIEASLDKQRSIAEIYVAMRRCPQPIISCVQGAASGGGFAFALASDIRILSEDARMNAAFIRIGLSACDMGVSYFLPRMIGQSLASEYMLTGRFIDARRAFEIGLANRVVPAAELLTEADAFAQDMLHATPLGLRLTKDCLNHSIDASGLEAVMAIEDRSQMLTANDPNFREGVAAFMEKRAPKYS
ncbi:enoyl-CoA hydratase/isomerase family protein [Hyphomonas sp.]|uniref:enoyl-CoA hydratase/isomerase family protein n=1 Tax=Hyphomonas sp. TaxID=87 RepID=UPI0025C0BC22|nr:enoyl-CoA hydratase/isomerase family protein [Hyphomonas sp.]MBI1399261.1 enoyl-CoA hydratase/isomerase family protein [Hyphomonas sp.]